MTEWPAIVAEHGEAVWRTVYRLLDHHADAMDCYQETFLAAWQFAHVQPVADWPALLTTLATRKALDRLRKRYRERARNAALDNVSEPTAAERSPSRDLDAKELMERMRQGMAEIPAKQAQVFWLCFEGLSHREIADRLEIAPGEVRVLLHRARARLRAILDDGQRQETDAPDRRPEKGREIDDVDRRPEKWTGSA